MPGSGPYLFDKSKLRIGKYITVVRRNDFWAEYNPTSGEFKYNEGIYNFDEVRIKIVTEDRIALEKFKKGELDIYFMGRSQWWNEDFVYNIENPSYDKLYRGQIQMRKIFGHNPNGLGGICMNLRRWPFDNKNVRQSFDKLWDRERLIRELFFNEYAQGDTYFPVGAYRDKSRKPTQFDPDGAIKLLNDAGYSTNNDGWLTAEVFTCTKDDISYSYNNSCEEKCEEECVKEEKRLEFDFGMTQGLDRFLTIFQDDLQNVGIKMNIKFLSGSQIFKNVQNERDFDVYYGAWVGGYFPAPWYFYHSDNAHIPGTVNFNGFSDSIVDSLIDEYRNNWNVKERVELIKQIDDILLDETLYLHSWQAPYSLRVLYWNKFGYPKHYIGYDGDWQSTVYLWWYDPKKAEKLIKSRDDKSLMLEKYDDGEINVYYDKIMEINN